MCARLPRFRRLSSRRAPPSSAKERERSEEHTSELQSQSNLVCRLLLEKKKLQKARHRGPVLSLLYLSLADAELFLRFAAGVFFADPRQHHERRGPVSVLNLAFIVHLGF